MFVKLKNEVDGGEQLFHVELIDQCLKPSMCCVAATPVESERCLHCDSGIAYKNRMVVPCYARVVQGSGGFGVHWFRWGNQVRPLPFTLSPWLNKRFGVGLTREVFTADVLKRLSEDDGVPKVLILDDCDSLSVHASTPIDLCVVDTNSIEYDLAEGSKSAIDKVNGLPNSTFDRTERSDPMKELADLADDFKNRHDDLPWDGEPPKHEVVYEVRPTITDGRDVSPCMPGEADRWSVFRRAENGLYYWMSDHVLREDADKFVDMKKKEPT